jgi:hypothetical protein
MSEGSQQKLSERLENTMVSVAPLLVTPLSETTGRRHINLKTGKPYWYKDTPRRGRARNKKKNAISRLAYAMVGSQKAFYALDKYARAKVRKGAARLYEAGETAGSAERSTEKAGFVYIITHPSWPEFVKIGRAYNPDSRLEGYQTGCPRRCYRLEHSVYFEDCHFAEREIHVRLGTYRQCGEWFRVTRDKAYHTIIQLREII